MSEQLVQNGFVKMSGKKWIREEEVKEQVFNRYSTDNLLCATYYQAFGIKYIKCYLFAEKMKKQQKVHFHKALNTRTSPNYISLCFTCFSTKYLYISFV